MCNTPPICLTPYSRQDPVFLRFLARLVNRGQASTSGLRVRPARNSFLGKWGFFARQQQPLPLSCVRRLQQPPSNVTVRHQNALAYLRALPCPAPQQTCIYAASSPAVHELLWHKGRATTWPSTWNFETHSLQAACPLSSALTTCQRPGSRADSIRSLCSGKNGSKPKLLHQGNDGGAHVQAYYD